MKKLMLIALCASSLMPAAPVYAQHHRPDRNDRQHHRPDRGDRSGFEERRHSSELRHRRWRRGERFDRRYARNYEVIDYRRHRGLRPPPRGYRYVRSGNDAVMVGIATGIVAAVIANAVR